MNRLFLSLLLAIAAMFTVFAVSSSPTAARPAGNCLFYSDASHTTLVGKFGVDCCNNVYAWGTTSPFSQCSQACFVCFPPPR
jgi:Family of unknown function (DUF6289)